MADLVRGLSCLSLSSNQPNETDQTNQINQMNPSPATRRNLVIRAFNHRLCLAGKAKKLALTTCTRKLFTFLNEMRESETPWWVNVGQEV
jgi:hypothetical protein